MRHELICTQAATPPRLTLRKAAMPQPGRGQVLVRVQATSVNPIDAKRATGYGARLLALKGAGRFPLVLGNDFAGVVEAAGVGASRFAWGQRVFGLLGTGRAGGAHRSHVVVPQEQLLSAPAALDAPSLAVLPYCFTTMWLAVRSSGLTPENARGRRVLINGADGGLGRLALQLLRPWACRITAICGPGQAGVASALGADVAVERGPGRIEALPVDAEVVLNFGAWADEAALASRLGPLALGQATTVHPLLGNLDQLGWWRGALASRAAWRGLRGTVAARSPGARYAWTVFKPDRAAMAALAAGVQAGGLSLPVGIAVPFEQASAAFHHVSTGAAGRAVLLA
jgi:NADPH:quinone reductase-like Zn-dependent oxidoreductase